MVTGRFTLETVPPGNRTVHPTTVCTNCKHEIKCVCLFVCVIYEICFMNCQHHSYYEPFTETFLFCSFLDENILFIFFQGTSHPRDCPRKLIKSGQLGMNFKVTRIYTDGTC